MSSSKQASKGTEGADGMDDTDGANGTDGANETGPGGLGEVVPEPLMPAWRRLESIQEFRRTYGGTYTGVLEAITAAVLIGGYVWWLYLFVVG